MSELPPADTTPLRVTGTLFKDLVFAFEPQDIPDGARILRTLKRDGAIIMDELEEASIVLIDPELPGAPDLLREAASKIVLHYSWVDKSVNVGHPLVESNNWGDCRVTPDNINDNFGYFPPPPNPQLQTPRPTPENRSYSFSTPSWYSQGSSGIVPPSSQPRYTPTPSHWTPDPVMLERQKPQLPPTQVSPYSSQPMQPPSLFSPFPMSQPTDMSTMTYGQQSPWSSFQSGSYGTVQQPTIEDLRRAYELMVMWFQRPPMYQQLLPPPTPTQSNAAFQLPPLLPTESSPSTSTQSEAPRVPGTSLSTILSRQDPIDSIGAFPNLGDLSGGSSKNSTLPVSSSMEPEVISSPLPLNNDAWPATLPTPLHTHPKLFEHDVGKPIMFCVPIILKNRGKIAEIFRATGGGFTDDVEDADYVVLGQWEEHYFDEMWYSAQDCNKPTVTPAFVLDSYEKGELMDPNNYPTRGPEKVRKDGRKIVRSRPTTGSRGKRGKDRGGASPRPLPSGETPKWLRFFKEAEHVKSLQYIGAMLKKNAELTHDALAIHLHNKMSNHTINSWKKYCLYRKNAIEDLRKRAIGNAEKKAISKDLANAIGTEATGATLSIPQRVDPQQINPQPDNPQQIDPPQLVLQKTVPQLTNSPQPTSQPTMTQQAISHPIIPQPAVPQPYITQQAVLRPITPRQATPQPAASQQASHQPVVPQQATSLHESQPPPPPYEKVEKSGPILVKTEPLDEDQLDFAFATEVLSGWRPNEESDSALWKRMETMRPSATASSWEAFCEKHWSRFEHFFTGKPARA